MGRLRETLDIRDERTDEDARAPFPPGRRHRASHMSELRINDASQSSLESAESARPAGEREQAGIALRVTSAETDAPAPVRTGALTDELRAALWDIIDFFLFAARSEPHSGEGHSGEGGPTGNDAATADEPLGTRDAAPTQPGFDDDGPWSVPNPSVVDRPSVRRVWCAPPISGDETKLPEDVAKLLEGWFSLVEPADVYAFVESAHDALDAPYQARFAAACNAALERALAEHRFVVKSARGGAILAPIASRADAATIEKALAAAVPEETATGSALLDALVRLSAKPEPDGRGAMQEAVRAVEIAAFTLTGERYLTLEDALTDLRERGFVDGATQAAHRGLFAFAQSSTRPSTVDAARRALVMCAAFVTHLASMEESPASVVPTRA